MRSLKALTAAGLSCCAIMALTMPASGQTVRGERASPSTQTPDGFAPQQVAGQEDMTCSRRLRIHYTQRGIAIFCNDNRNTGRMFAIDHDKFPGGLDAAMTLLTRAQQGFKSGDGTLLRIRYRSATAKARLICNLAQWNFPDRCHEVVKLDI